MESRLTIRARRDQNFSFSLTFTDNASGRRYAHPYNTFETTRRVNKMKSRFMKLAIRSKALCLVLTLLTAVGSANADILGEKPWTTVGAAGTVSPGDTNDVAYFTGGWVGLTNNASFARIRYNVVAVDGLKETAFVLTRARLTVKFLDNGPNAHVRVTLKELDLNNSLGAGAHLMTLYSDNFAPDNQFQTQYTSCQSLVRFDFVNKAYFVEVELERPAGSNGEVGLAVIQLGMSDDPCLTQEPPR
jgi:hypothetical protein